MTEILSDLIDDVVRTAKILGAEEEAGSCASVLDAEANYLITRRALDRALAQASGGGTALELPKPRSDRMAVGD